ncbi:hypothetical protein [Sciscionella sediminilitoris]|uniref:hypothetical protein n=1 Tax=Sciscionella sediminilitoris TaxID=1445613 RepID=UPI0004DF6537|nr:hypothetical protein [Sciscionella sp. SE31]
MNTAIVIVVLLVVVIAAIVLFTKRGNDRKADELGDAKAEARRWIERLGGQVFQLEGTTEPAAKQAIADASERYTAAGSQIEQASTTRQCQLATHTAMEGLYYVRAAREALGLDPGPELPEMDGQRAAGSVTENRKVQVEGHDYAASPNPGEETPHYYPGGTVAGRPVPRGWYSEPWWKPALIGGAWGVGSMLLFDSLFSGMHGFGGGWDAGGFDPGMGDMGGDFGGMDMGMDGGDFGDFGGFDLGDW